MGTSVMQGWQLVKQVRGCLEGPLRSLTGQKHFEKHGPACGATFHPVYGWQAGPNMVKLSLLVLLDGEAVDMDEWELEILSQTWAYVTILLSERNDSHSILVSDTQVMEQTPLPANL
jgi:hypothetical protein